MRLAVLFIMVFVLCSAQGLALQITEVFYKGNAFIRSEERYVEIFNDSLLPVSLSNLTVSVPKSDTEALDIGLETGRFLIRRDDAVTDSLVLPPYGYAVVMTEDYNRYARLFSFAPGSLLLKPKLKSFSGWSWADRIGLIGLKTNGAAVFSCADFSMPSDRDIPEMKSLSLIDGRWVAAGLSPGTNGRSELYADRLFIRGNESTVICYRDPETTNQSITVQVKVNNVSFSTFQIYRVMPGLWEGTCFVPGLVHGDDVRVVCGGSSVLLRYLEPRPLSEYFGSVLINEIVTDPKRDYSGGGWTGSDGGGKIDSTDEWMELVNASDREFSVSNFYILYKSKTTESVKDLSIRTNAGYGKKSPVLSNYNYMVVSAENGMSDSAVVALYDGYPYRNGRILDEVAYGGEEWENAPSGKSSGTDDEAIARVPNAVRGPHERDVFKKTAASYARANEIGPALLWVRDVTGVLTNAVYLIDADNTNKTAMVSFQNGLDAETLVLTNYCVYFFGILSMKNEDGVSGDGFLNVKNGVRNSASYLHRNPDVNATASFSWAKEGWSLPEETADLKRVIVYPNPLSAGKKNTLVFANLPGGTAISVIDGFGNIVKQIINNGEGFSVWETELKKGIYIAVFRYGTEVVSRKLLVR